MLLVVDAFALAAFGAPDAALLGLVHVAGAGFLAIDMGLAAFGLRHIMVRQRSVLQPVLDAGLLVHVTVWGAGVGAGAGAGGLCKRVGTSERQCGGDQAAVHHSSLRGGGGLGRRDRPADLADSGVPDSQVDLRCEAGAQRSSALSRLDASMLLGQIDTISGTRTGPPS